MEEVPDNGRQTALTTEPETRPLFSIIQAAGWPIWPLIACSVLALALVIERFLSLKRTKVAPPQLLDEAMAVARYSVPAADVVTQLEQNSALGEVLASGFRALGTNPKCTEVDLRSAMEGSGRVVAHRLERYLSALERLPAHTGLVRHYSPLMALACARSLWRAGQRRSSRPAARCVAKAFTLADSRRCEGLTR